MKTPPKVFITYSHKNTAKREWLERCLAVMKSKKEIEIWSDARVSPGGKWEPKIAENLKESDILFYLVSVDSLASVNCNQELIDKLDEVPNVPVVPIVLECCDFGHHSLVGFNALPKKNGDITPISSTHWKDDRSEAWQNVVDGIRNAIADIPSKPTSGGSDTPPSTPKGPKPDSPTREQEAVIFLNRANFSSMLGENDRAVVDYAKAINMNPNHAASYNNRGAVYNNKGNYDRAIKDFNKAIELNPNYAEAYTNRGIAKRMKNDKGAREDFEIALQLAKQQENKDVVDSIQKAIDSLR